ncbi:phytoene/squalene synthase family protein [Stella sp.]|uniref:phytoene/squalene synthase family protein n=1 Tax=Stella sp. TaxID=2912054 RepID=UPI0035AD98F4
MPSAVSLSPAGETARRQDPDRFLAALTAPADRREHLFAVLAFEHEIARTREVVSEPVLGEIRLQWWADMVAEIAVGGGARPPEPLAALRAAVAEGGVPPAVLAAMVEGRRRDLEEGPPATLDALEDYARATGGAVGRALAAALGQGAAAGAAVEVGTGWALTGILRALPFRTRHNEVFLPTEALAAAGLTPHSVAAGRGGAGLAGIVRQVAARAEARFAAARAERPPAGLRPALLPARLARVHLARLAAAGHDPFAPALARPDGLRALRVAWGSWTGRWW